MKNFELRTTESTIHEPSSLICMLLLGGCWLALSASGQFSIDWFTIDGGGATSTSGVYSISGTIGQPDAGGAITGGNYSLTGGFWSLLSVVSTPGVPALYITGSGSTVTVFWQNVPGWSLLQNGDLANPNGWSASGGVTTSNGTNYLSLASPPGKLFFRLKR